MKNCPYCGSHGNFYFEFSLRTYNRCSECGLIYKKDHVSYDKVLAHYRDDYFEKYSADQMSGERSRLFDKILDLIEERKSSDTLLDVGTGCGFFLMAAKKRGWKVRGIEPSIQSVEIASRESGLDIYSGTFQEYDKKGEFDVITFINVLDHSMEPWKDVERAINLLKSGGIIYFRFPNGLWHTQIYRLISKLGLASLIRKFLVFHEVCFSPKFIKRLLSDFGFTDVVVYNAGLSGGSLIRLSPFFSFAVQWIEILEKVTDTISGGRFLWGPSLEVIATKK